MRLIRPVESSRLGFTLIELMVVITIIAVLVALLMAGVFAALARMAVTQTRYEIGSFEEGFESASK